MATKTDANKSTVDWLRSLATQVRADTEKIAEEEKEETTAESATGEAAAKTQKLADEAKGVDKDKPKEDKGMVDKKKDDPERGEADKPATDITVENKGEGVSAKEAAFKPDMDKLAEATAYCLDLLVLDRQQKEAEQEVMQNYEQWYEVGKKHREKFIAEFDKMAEDMEQKKPGFKVAFDSLGGSAALLEKIAEVMPSAIAPEELQDEAGEAEQLLAVQNDVEQLRQAGIPDEVIAQAFEQVQTLLEQGVPPEAILEALSELAQEQMQGEGAGEVPPEAAEAEVKEAERAFGELKDAVKDKFKVLGK